MLFQTKGILDMKQIPCIPELGHSAVQCDGNI